MGVGDQWVKPGTGTGISRDTYVSSDDVSACRVTRVMTVLYKALDALLETVNYLLYVLKNETSLVKM